MLIGVVGTFASGKDTVAEYLHDTKGLPIFSTADELREIMAAQGLPLDRDTMHTYAAHVRTTEGQDFLERRVFKKITGDAVITSTRNVDGVHFLKNQGQYYLIAVDAPIELRFARAQKRHRAGDGQTLEEFSRQEAAERHGPGQQIDGVIELADYTIQNTGTLEEFHKKIDAVYADILKREHRTS